MRALLSVLLVAGFYVIGLVELIAVGILTWELTAVVPGLVALQITQVLLVAIVAGAGVALWRAMRAPDEPSPGVVVTGEKRLWELVNAIAAEVGTRPPDEIRIVAEVNAAVAEHTRMLGLVSGRRYLYIGLPLLRTLPLDQLTAILAHELGHYSNAHTRFGGVAYRARLAVSGTLSRIGHRNPVGWGFIAYGFLYVLLDNAVSRKQELAADAAAARVAGKAATISALTRVHVVAAAFDYFLDRYARPGAELGFVPREVFGKFAEFLTVRQDDVAPDTDAKVSVWATHPPLPVRVAAIEATPDLPETGPTGPALALLDDNYEDVLVGHLFVTGKPMSWADFVGATSTVELQTQVDYLFRDMRRTQGVKTVPEMVERLTAIRDHESLALVQALAALRSQTARWEPSWTGPAMLVGLDGEPLALDKMDIDPFAVTVQEQTASARGAVVVGGLGNVKLGGVEADLLVLDVGLIAINTKGDSDEGKKRMQHLIATVPLDELARNNRFIPFEEIRRVTVNRQVPIRAAIELSNGETVELREPWTGDRLDRTSSETLVELLRQFA